MQITAFSGLRRPQKVLLSFLMPAAPCRAAHAPLQTGSSSGSLDRSHYDRLQFGPGSTPSNAGSRRSSVDFNVQVSFTLQDRFTIYTPLAPCYSTLFASICYFVNSQENLVSLGGDPPYGVRSLEQQSIFQLAIRQEYLVSPSRE